MDKNQHKVLTISQHKVFNSFEHSVLRKISTLNIDSLSTPVYVSQESTLDVDQL